MGPTPWHGPGIWTRRGCSADGLSHLHISVSHYWLSCPSRGLTTVDASFRRDPRGDRPQLPGPARPHWPARETHKCKFSAFVSELMECCWMTVGLWRERSRVRIRKIRLKNQESSVRESKKEPQGRKTPSHSFVCGYYHERGARSECPPSVSVWHRRQEVPMPSYFMFQVSLFPLPLLSSLLLSRQPPAESTSSPIHRTIYSQERSSASEREHGAMLKLWMRSPP